MYELPLGTQRNKDEAGSQLASRWSAVGQHCPYEEPEGDREEGANEDTNAKGPQDGHPARLEKEGDATHEVDDLLHVLLGHIRMRSAAKGGHDED